MTIQHRRIPVLPKRSSVHPIAGQIYRSYPVGRQSFSRAFQGEVLTLTITMEDPLPDNIQAGLVTTLNSKRGYTSVKVPFVLADKRTLVCNIIPKCPGLHSFRAEFSLDRGTKWFQDTVPDAWVLIDPPQVNGLRLYTLIPAVSGTIADWKTDLKRISNMGFNAIHLLPITTQDTSQSPYAARDLFDIDHSYLMEGSKKKGLLQLEEYIQEAITLDIKLCFDIVLNHVGVQSTMARQAPDWIVPDRNQPDGFKRAGYWSGHEWLTWKDLVLINYEHPSKLIRSEIRKYMIDYAFFWTKYADATGGFVRFDNLHSSDPEFVDEFTGKLHSKYPMVGLLAEYFTDELTLLNTVPKWGLNLILATPWNYKFVPQLRDYLNHIHHVSGHIRYFMPITSHDSGAPAEEFGSADSTVPRYVAAALMGTVATGIPQGVEIGEKERIRFVGRSKKMQFSTEQRFARFFKKVNTILVDNPAFQRGDNCKFVDDGHPAIIAVFRRDGDTRKFGFLVVCNFDTHTPQHIVVDLSPFLGTDGPFPCTELLSGETQIIPQSRLEILLQPCAAQVLRFNER
jgi:glycosidase